MYNHKCDMTVLPGLLVLHISKDHFDIPDILCVQEILQGLVDFRALLWYFLIKLPVFLLLGCNGRNV